MLKVFCSYFGVTRVTTRNIILPNSSINRRLLSSMSNCMEDDKPHVGEDSRQMPPVGSAAQVDLDSPCKGDNGLGKEKGDGSTKRRNRNNRKKKSNSESDSNASPGKPQQYANQRKPDHKFVSEHQKNGYAMQNRRPMHSMDGRNNFNSSSPQKQHYGASNNFVRNLSNQTPDKSRSQLPEIQFEEYITHEECSEGLKRGELIKGSFRINMRNYREGYIDDNEGLRDIQIEGTENRNRAFPGDIIAVKLLPKDQWKKKPGCEGDGEDTYFAKTGKVVYIIEKKHSRVASGFLTAYKNHAFKIALMSPVDSRIPRLMIPLPECPKNFSKRPHDFQNTLFVARIIDWGINMPFASGQLMKSLGEAGHIEPETEAIILSNDIDSSEFSKDVIHCLPNGETWRITEEELAKRKDLREECIFTIDPATARDLDDALSCKKIGDDLYEVGVHIADVSHFIDLDNELDKVAKSRATSVYLAQKVIPMLPRVLCEQLCSLNPGVERLSYSVIWNLKSDGTVVREWFGRSVIRSCVKLSYDHAQEMIDCSSHRDIDSANFPPVDRNISLEKIVGTVKHLYGISAHLRKGRFDSGALKIDMPKIAFSLDDQTGTPNGCRVYAYKQSNEMIEEFMLLANMAVGTKIYRSHPKLAILRLHPPPQDNMMQDLVSLCDAFEIPFDTRDSASINSSLHNVHKLAGETGRENLYAALTLMCAKPFNNAKYFCTGSIPDEHMYRHYALNVPIYTHFTSPIRRYPDVMVHRLLTAALDSNFKVPDDVKQLQTEADHCNDKKWAAKKASEQSSLLFFAVYIKECGPISEKGVVVGILSRAVDILSSRLGTVHRVYTDQLSIVKHDFEADEITPQMTLHWRNDADTKEGTIDEKLAALTKQFEQKWALQKQKDENKNSPDVAEVDDKDVIKQELKIFTCVDLILSVKPSAPTKIVAHLLNPHHVDENPGHGL